MRQSVFLQEREPCTSTYAILIQSAEVVWLQGWPLPRGVLHYLSQLISHSLILHKKSFNQLKSYAVFVLLTHPFLPSLSFSLENFCCIIDQWGWSCITMHHECFISSRQKNKKTEISPLFWCHKWILENRKKIFKWPLKLRQVALACLFTSDIYENRKIVLK